MNESAAWIANELRNPEWKEHCIPAATELMLQAAATLESRFALSAKLPAIPAGWRDVIAKLRLGLAAGSRSRSNTDFEIEYGVALFNAVEEKLEALESATNAAPPPAKREA